MTLAIEQDQLANSQPPPPSAALNPRPIASPPADFAKIEREQERQKEEEERGLGEQHGWCR